jgi:DNA-binding SARP family transcriptional activator
MQAPWRSEDRVVETDGRSKMTMVLVPTLPRVTVQGGFSLQTDEGRAVVVVGEARRLLAMLALNAGMLPRAFVAGTLWPEVTESHAHSSLRSALARMPEAARDLLQVSHLEVGLAAGVAVDVHESRALAYRLLERNPDDRDWGADAVVMLSADLLPGWYDSWMLFEAEEWRQLRIHALEILANQLADLGYFGAATTAGLAAIRADPLRESAHATLIRVHLAEGNQSEALRQFDRYRALLKTELGLDPTPRLRSLVDSFSLGVRGDVIKLWVAPYGHI